MIHAQQPVRPMIGVGLLREAPARRLPHPRLRVIGESYGVSVTAPEVRVPHISWVCAPVPALDYAVACQPYLAGALPLPPAPDPNAPPALT